MTPINLLRGLSRDTRGLALLEFAFCFPILLLMLLGGAELVNYTTTRMRISQVALQIADNAARMGNGPQLSAKTITEADVSDVFTGGQVQSGSLDLQANGRVILSDLEPTADPNTTGTYKIGWQRCYGARSHASTYGNAGQTGMPGIGPADQRVTTQDDNATMFVEVYYVYKPIVSLARAPSSTISEIASMPVRDRRNLADGIQPAAGTTAMTC